MENIPGFIFIEIHVYLNFIFLLQYTTCHRDQNLLPFRNQI